MCLVQTLSASGGFLQDLPSLGRDGPTVQAGLRLLGQAIATETIGIRSSPALNAGERLLNEYLDPVLSPVTVGLKSSKKRRHTQLLNWVSMPLLAW
jgi:hypothetical protein